MIIEVSALKASVTLAWAGGDGYSILDDTKGRGPRGGRPRSGKTNVKDTSQANGVIHRQRGKTNAVKA